MKKTVEIRQFRPDKNSPVALHLQLAEELLKELRALSPNDDCVLPSERTLVKELGINRMTVHRAYAYLLDNKLVERRADKSLSVAKTARKQLQGNFPVIGVILPEKFSLYVKRQLSLEYLKGIIDRATECGVSAIMLNPPLPGADESVIDDFIATHCASLSGIIHLGSRGYEKDNVLEKILNYTGVPQVFVSGQSTKPHIGAVCINVKPGITGICRELEKRNVRSIGIITRTGQAESPFIYNFSSRAAEAKEVFEANGFEVKPVAVFPPSQENIEISTDDLPDAFWCFNDNLAGMLIKFLKERGIRVPHDVPVSGFDGVESCFDGMKITTVDHRMYDIGYSAVDLVLEHYEYGVTAENRIKTVDSVFVPGDTL